MINPLSINKEGELRVGEVVTIRELFSEGAILEKQYEITTMKDLDQGKRRYATKKYYVGKKRAAA